MMFSVLVVCIVYSRVLCSSMLLYSMLYILIFFVLIFYCSSVPYFSVLVSLGFFKKFGHWLYQMLLIGLWKFTVDIYCAQIWITAYVIIRCLGVRLNLITKFNFNENFVTYLLFPLNVFSVDNMLLKRIVSSLIIPQVFFIYHLYISWFIFEYLNL